MISLDFKAAKEGFFDRTKVIDAVDRATKGVLSKFGSFVRQRAKSSIRKRKRPSKPGEPPSSHVGTLKDLIFFSFDQSRRSVVVGPILFASAARQSHPATEVLEYGGDAEMTELKWKTRHGQRTLDKTTKMVHIKPRPYMHPALAMELPGLPAMWRDSVR